MEKLDKIQEENPGQSLDDLVAAKKINNDQRAQGLRKPILNAQRDEYSEQLKKYEKFVDDYEERLVKQRESLTSTNTTAVEAIRAEVTREVKKEMEIEFKRRLLTFTRFLKAAAGRRQTDEDSEESKAFESVLCGVYAGDAAAVDCAESLVNGSEEKVPEYTGPVNVTCEYFPHHSAIAAGFQLLLYPKLTSIRCQGQGAIPSRGTNRGRPMGKW